MILTIKLDRNWSSFQLANSAPPLSVTGSAIAPSARISHMRRKNYQHCLVLKSCGEDSPHELVPTHRRCSCWIQSCPAAQDSRTCVLMRLDIAVRKNWGSHIDASHSRQPLVKGERLVRYEVNAVIAHSVLKSLHFIFDFKLLRFAVLSCILEFEDIHADTLASNG